MTLLLPGPVALRIHLVPRLRRQYVMHILHLRIPPDVVVHALPPQRLERVVHVRQRHPPPAVQLRQQALVRKVHVHRPLLHVLHDLPEEPLRRVDHLQPAVHEAQRARRHGVRADALRLLGGAVLRREGAVLRRPVLGVVRLLERVADARVAGREDAHAGVALAGAGGGGGELAAVAVLAGAVAALGVDALRGADELGGGVFGGEVAVVELELHELVHVAQHEHVAVELDDAGVLVEAEGGELAPAVVEARVVGVVAPGGREEVLDALGGDAAALEGGEALGREGVCVERDEGVRGVGLEEGVVEGEEAGEVV